MKLPMDPAACAEVLIEKTEEALPPEWTTDELATFWHRLTEHCTLRLVRLKPEIVRRMRPEDR